MYYLCPDLINSRKLIYHFVVMNVDDINKRYTCLSDTSCCLSCGGAFEHAYAKNREICVDLGSGRGNDVNRLAELVSKNGYV